MPGAAIITSPTTRPLDGGQSTAASGWRAGPLAPALASDGHEGEGEAPAGMPAA
jgi:hypothetical protein